MDMVTLAGVSGVGKTTLAKAVASEKGKKYVSVYAPPCWAIIDPVARQKCFLVNYVTIILGAPGEALLDNSLLTVYAYTEAILSRAKIRDNPEADMLLMAIERLLDKEEEKHQIIVIDKPCDEIEKGIRARLGKEKERLANPFEPSMELHCKAREILLETARIRGLPIVSQYHKEYLMAVIDWVAEKGCRLRPLGVINLARGDSEA